MALVAAQSSPERTRSLLAGHFQGALIGRSDNAFLRSQGVTELVDLRDLYPDYANRVIATSGTMLAQRPEAVKGFLKGMIRAYRWLRDPAHRAEAAPIVAWSGLHVEFFEDAYDDLVRGLPDDGAVSARGLHVVIEDLQASGQIPADYTAERVLRPGPLQAAQRELGLAQ